MIVFLCLVDSNCGQTLSRLSPENLELVMTLLGYKTYYFHVASFHFNKAASCPKTAAMLRLKAEKYFDPKHFQAD